MSKEGGRSSYNSPYFTDSRPTLAVVTLCVAIRGSSTKIGKVSSITGLRQALQMLAGDAMSDDGENVLAAELLWTVSALGISGISEDVNHWFENPAHLSAFPFLDSIFFFLLQPQDNGDVLTKRDIVEDYPELMDL